MFQETQRKLFQTLKHQLIVFEVEVWEGLDGHERRVVVRGGLGKDVLEGWYYYRDAQARDLRYVVLDYVSERAYWDF